MASSHLSIILGDPMGVGEALTYIPTDGSSSVDLIGVWSDHASDARHAIGIGMESTVSGARCRISMADVPRIDPAAVIIRAATGERWKIDQASVSAEVAWMLELSKETTSDVRSLR